MFLEIAKTIILVIGCVISTTLFWLGWKLYKNRNVWLNRHNSIYLKQIPVVNRKTGQWKVVRTFNDYFFEELFS